MTSNQDEDLLQGGSGLPPVFSLKRQSVPIWAVGVAVLVVAGVAAWAIFQREDDKKAVWPAIGYLPHRIGDALSPALAAVEQGINGQAAAQPATGQAMATQPWSPTATPGTELRGIPNIRAGVTATHAYRGSCAGCHAVVDNNNWAVPTIFAQSRMAHDYRGVCNNCHDIAVGAVPASAPAYAAAAAPTLAPQNGALPAAAIGAAMAGQAPAARRAPTTPAEGEWLGLEVAPLTPTIATQYNIAAGTVGLVVAEAEAQAATSGFRAGDVVAAINGLPIRDMTTFFQATQNGLATRGTVDFIRAGQRMTMALSSAPPAPAQAPAPVANAIPGTPANPSLPVAAQYQACPQRQF